HHRLSAADSLARVLDHMAASALTWLVLGIALALPVGLSVMLDNVDRLSAAWDTRAQISLFLEEDVTIEQARQLQSAVAQRADVAQAVLVSREQALEEFGALSGFADVLDALEQNPLPHLLLVSPLESLDADAISALRGELQAAPGAARAVLDMQWLQRLHTLLELARRLLLAVGALLVVGVVLILGNTIRLAIENRRDEIVIVKLVGGSNAFVRRPFLYTGLWYGVGGGLCAALLVQLALWFLQAPVAALAALYDSDFQLRSPGVMGALNLVLLGGLLGLAGAWLAVARHLAHIEPR
ncbi:MAG: permease-like cell division protein FtsX, partial [Halioglobus sp.]|nr:permease-like cell division protein FtsX [Halioglobus sp.]